MTTRKHRRARPQRPTINAAPRSPADIFAELQNDLGVIFTAIEWAEDEIAHAQQRHPGKPEMWATFHLLLPTHDLMCTELVYRAHCRELLERAAAGEDTRPATDAEIALACAGASELAPLTPAATGLYFRVWSRAFPSYAVVDDQARGHHEALHGSQIDRLETVTRRKARQDWRTFDRDEALRRVDDRISNEPSPGVRIEARA